MNAVSGLTMALLYVTLIMAYVALRFAPKLVTRLLHALAEVFLVTWDATHALVRWLAPRPLELELPATPRRPYLSPAQVTALEHELLASCALGLNPCHCDDCAIAAHQADLRRAAELRQTCPHAAPEVMRVEVAVADRARFVLACPLCGLPVDEWETVLAQGLATWQARLDDEIAGLPPCPHPAGTFTTWGPDGSMSIRGCGCRGHRRDATQ